MKARSKKSLTNFRTSVISIFRNRNLIVATLLVAATLLVYAPIRDHQFLRYDDYTYVARNARIQQGLTWENVAWAMTAFQQDLWKPVTLLSHMLDCQLFGLNPTGHLLMNLLFHVVNVILLFGVLQLMTGAMWPSALVAALFALHPLNVESVAWVAERKNVLSTLFWLLTMWAYVGYTRKPNWQRYLGVMGALVLGLMTKPMLVTLPCVLLLMDYWPLGRLPAEWNGFRKRLPGLVADKLPFFIPVAMVSALTIYGVESGSGGVAGLVDLSLGARLNNTLVGYGLYLKKMVWPTDLVVFYPHPGGSLSSWSVVLAALVLVGISLWVWARKWRSCYLVVGWLWYLGTLVPVNGLLQSGGQAMADRYAYVPLIGVFIMLAWGATGIMENHGLRRKWLVVAGACVLIPLTFLTRVQLRYWQDTTTLFEHALQVTPDNHVAHNVLGLELTEKREFKDAIEHLEEAVRIRPKYSQAHYNLGVALIEQGSFDQAMEHFAEALKLNPRRADAHNNLGFVLREQKRLDEAVEHFSRALEIDPQLAEAQTNLDIVLDEAIEWYARALQSAPNDAVMHNKLGALLLRKGEVNKAVQHFSEAVKIDPGYRDAQENLNRVQSR
ncbi:tetratricopeptide repeat protein [Acidobacteria bacterium AH-259-D05]|nr:tetratricopeptide repeat protein [Acidobacteria bacterium AH-259-D05]